MHNIVDCCFPYLNIYHQFTSGRWQSKTLMLSTNVDKIVRNSVSIAICRQSGDKWQSKTMFLSIFDRRSLIAQSVFDCRLPGV